MAATTEAQRRAAHEQALASSRLEGHVPTPEYLADCEAVIAGTMTLEGARAASLARALIRDEERARRQAGVDFARGSVRLEGFELSAEIEDITSNLLQARCP
jgi:hypothetical protein